MSSSARSTRFESSVATSVRVSRGRLYVLLADGREIGVPLSRFPRLRGASPSQLRRWEIIAFGTGIRWPDLDEDVGVAGLLRVQEEDLEAAAGFTLGSRPGL